jgi:hypothetical protein
MALGCIDPGVDLLSVDEQIFEDDGYCICKLCGQSYMVSKNGNTSARRHVRIKHGNILQHRGAASAPAITHDIAAQGRNRRLSIMKMFSCLFSKFHNEFVGQCSW